MRTRFARTRFALATAGAAALALPLLAAVPAHAAAYPLDTMNDSMLSASQAQSLGVAGNHLAQFLDVSGSKGAPQPIWICDLEGSTEIEVDGSPNLYVKEYSSEKGKVATLAQQELYSYDSEDAARKAMKTLRKVVKKCEGTFKVKHDAGWVSTQKVSHGKGTYSDGDKYIWVKHVTTISEPGTEVDEHEYSVFQQFGNFIQTMEIDVEGVNAPKLTSSQIKSVTKVSHELSEVWGG